MANISILGYDPAEILYRQGPLRSSKFRHRVGRRDVAFRCNLVTAFNDTLVDYSAGHISSKEAAILIKFIDQNLGTDRIKFYPGVSYRHLMLVKNGQEEHLEDLKCMPPHDITGQSISKNLPKAKTRIF